MFKHKESFLIIIVLGIFALYGLAMYYNFMTGKPIPDDLSLFMRIAMGAAGLAISRFLLSVGKNEKDDDDENNSGSGSSRGPDSV